MYKNWALGAEPVPSKLGRELVAFDVALSLIVYITCQTGNSWLKMIEFLRIY